MVGILGIDTFEVLDYHQVSFLEKAAETVAAVISSTLTNEHTRKLLDETKELAERLSSQEEELR